MIEIQFKSGDIVTCIKDFKTPKWIRSLDRLKNLHSGIFIKNRDYKVTDSNYYDDAKNIIVYTIEGTWRFYEFEGENLALNKLKFFDHFCSKRELRKDKINKINEG
jgi:hypothetical protein